MIGSAAHWPPRRGSRGHGICCTGAAVRIPRRRKPTSCMPPRRVRCRPWYRWQARAGVSKVASKPPKERWGWMSTKCAAPPAGTGTSPSPCGPWRCWPSSARPRSRQSPWQKKSPPAAWRRSASCYGSCGCVSSPPRPTAWPGCTGNGSTNGWPCAAITGGVHGIYVYNCSTREKLLDCPVAKEVSSSAMK